MESFKGWTMEYHSCFYIPKCSLNTVLYNTEQSWTPNGQFRLFVYVYIFCSRYITNWIATCNLDIGLGPNNSVIKGMWCPHIVVLTFKEKKKKKNT